MILIIDNYDSFAYNLAQAFGAIGCTVTVERNDALTVDEALDRSPDGIVISPGPGVPAQAGVSVDLIRRAAGRVPILGVCLGHQCIAAAFGAAMSYSPLHSSVWASGCSSRAATTAARSSLSPIVVEESVLSVPGATHSS